MLKPAETGETFEAMLRKAGFDAGRPDLKTVWHVFTDFLRMEVDCAEDICFFECGVNDFSGESLFYLDLVRQFEIEEEGEYDHTEQVHFEAQFKPESELESIEESFWSNDYDSVDEFIREVEELPEFKALMEKYVPLKVEIYQEEI